MRAPHESSDSCQSVTSPSVSAHDFFAWPILKLTRACVASRYGNAGRRSEAGLPVGAAGMCALLSNRLARFQRPSSFRTRLILGSFALNVAISKRPRNRDLKRIAAETSCARTIGSALNAGSSWMTRPSRSNPGRGRT